MLTIFYFQEHEIVILFAEITESGKKRPTLVTRGFPRVRTQSTNSWTFAFSWLSLVNSKSYELRQAVAV